MMTTKLINDDCKTEINDFYSNSDLKIQNLPLLTTEFYNEGYKIRCIYIWAPA